jgi:NitT/TauT family transport system substrate-binding protein
MIRQIIAVTPKALLILLIGAGVVLPNGAAAQKPPATLRLDWIAGPFHIGPILAVKRGYYVAEGIDLTVLPGKGSVLTAQAVALGNDLFGYGDPASMALANSKGASLMMVVNTTPKGPSGIITLDTKIGSPRELEGKKVGLAAGEFSFAAFGAVVKKYGVVDSAVQRVTIEGSAKIPALLQRQVDAIPGYRFGDYLRVYTQNKNAKITLFSEWGINVLGPGYYVTASTLKSKPELVRGFVRATLRGWRDAVADQSAGIDALVEAYPETNRDLAKLGLPLVIEHMSSDATGGKPLGWMADADWNVTLEVMGLATAKSPLSSYFTNEFIPSR